MLGGRHLIYHQPGAEVGWYGDDVVQGEFILPLENQGGIRMGCGM